MVKIFKDSIMMTTWFSADPSYLLNEAEKLKSGFVSLSNVLMQ